MKRNASGERGMALMMVLGVLATALVLISHLMLIAQIISKEAYAVSTKGLMRYQAESAAETSFWMHLTDRRLFSNRTLGQTDDDDLRITEDFPPWMLDGRPHEFDDGRCIVYMNSGENGIRADNLSGLKQGLSAVDDADLITDIDYFIDVYNDYTDTDDLLNLNGYEADDYAADGFLTLPRNGPMEFKAELYWLPGWNDVITGEIATLPPMHISYNYNNSKDSIFNASAERICQLLDMDIESSEYQEIEEALRLWREEGTPLEDTLDGELMMELKSNFNFNEAGIAVIEANAYDAQREVMSGYRVVRESKISSKTFFADSHSQCLSIWERRWR